MNCELTEKISLLIDGELPSAEATALERHITICDECRLARADFLDFRSQISSYTSSLAPVASDPLLARLLEQPSVARANPSFVHGLHAATGEQRFSPRLVAIAATVLLAMALGAFSFLSYRSNRADNQTADKGVVNDGGADQGQNRLNPQPSTTGSDDPLAVADKRNRKFLKGRRAPDPQRKPESRGKQNRERSTPPAQAPQPRSLAPPTYANLIEGNSPDRVTPGSGELDTLRHLQQSELLLRAFRNVRFAKKKVEISYERKRAQRLVYRNIVLRREAETAGDVQVATLLASLEPILIDIANLRDKTEKKEVRVIQARMERKSLVALLQVNSAAVARANE